MELDAKSFFDGLSAESKPKEKSQNNVNRLSLASADMKGTIKLLPVVPDDFGGKPFIKLVGVRETFIKTNQTGKGNGWGYILPIEAYGSMTDEEVDLYNKVTALWDEVDKMIHDKNPKDFSRLRKKSYTLIAGIILDHMDIHGNQIKTHIGKPSLLCYPSPTMYKTIAESITNKVQALKGNVEIINKVFNNDSTGRKAALSLVFKWKDPNNLQQGYASNCSIDFNSEFDIAVDPDKDFGKENIDMMMTPLEVFLMWSYDHKNNKPFSVETFNEIRTSLLALKEAITKSEQELKEKLGETTDSKPSTTVDENADAPF